MTIALGARSTLVELHTGCGRPPLFLVHPNSGSAFCYAGLAQRLGHDRPVWGLQAPGFDGDALPVDRMEELAALHIAALRDVQADGPYHIGGWSSGGVAAYEMARQLTAAGSEVRLLALMDSTVPAGVPSAPLSKLIARFVDDLAGSVGAGAPDRPAGATSRPPRGELEEVEALLRSAGLIPPELSRRQLRVRLAVFVAAHRAVEAYRPGPYRGRVTLFEAERSRHANLRWDAFALDGMTHVMVAGDHHSILRPPHVARLAEGLRSCLTSSR
jgi:thioesterase domain-containing protein